MFHAIRIQRHLPLMCSLQRLITFCPPCKLRRESKCCLPSYYLSKCSFLENPIFAYRLAACLHNVSIGNVACWKCDSNLKLGAWFCAKCDAIQRPPKEINFFQLFELQDQYVIDDRKLTNSFRRIQMVLHPDKFSLRSPEEHSIAVEYSSLVNKAYSTLRHPWTRGVYLLKRAGIDFDEETTAEDPELLLEVMERNEQVAEACDLQTLDCINAENKKDIKDIIAAVSQSFEGKNLQLAKTELVKLKYFTNIDAKIGEKKLKYGASE